MLHTAMAGEIARQQIAILKQEGVKMGRVKIDHANDTTDLKYLTWILDQGCFLGLDRYPGSRITPEERTNCLKALIDMGYADRLCVSHDWSLARFLSRPSPAGSPAKKERKSIPTGSFISKKKFFPSCGKWGRRKKPSVPCW